MKLGNLPEVSVPRGGGRENTGRLSLEFPRSVLKEKGEGLKA